MTDFEARLARGPLRVRSVWSGGAPELLARRVLRQRRFFFGMGAAAACGCLALALFFVVQGRARLHANAVASQVASQTGPSTTSAAPSAVTTFSDGSLAEASSRDTEVRIEQDTPSHVVTRLTGGARFQVVHNRERTFEVRAGDVRVRVLGTVFSVQQLPSGQTQVLVERGRVEVAWLGGALLLDAGQGGTFPPTAGSEVEPTPPNVGGAIDLPASPPPSTHASAPHRASTGSWRDEARAGDYAKAYDEMSAKGPDGVRDDAADLMLAADVARLSGHPEDAVHPLRAVCDHHGGDRRAPVAAFTLGRVLADDLGRPAEAASAFQRARVLWPEGPLAEDALAREADAWKRAGRPDSARTAATAYVGRYPQGRQSTAMRQILTQ